MINIKTLIKSLLPGIFLFGFNVGTGSVTAMAKAGADYGMSLLWTIFISCAITYFLIHLFGKFTLVTGLTALQSFKRHIHPAVSILFIIALTAQICGSVIGVMGILADICYEWSQNFIDGGISPLYFAMFFITFVYVIFLIGKTDVFEKVLAVLVAVMAICFLINFFILMPPATEILKGMIPKIPEASADKNAFLVIASMVGTSVFSGLFILRTILVKEAGWTMADLKTQNRDALFSAFLMFIMSTSIMAAAAGSLYAQGITLVNVTQMIYLLEPLAGAAAVTIFTIGLIAAGVSSQFPNVALLPWLLDDFHERKTNLKRTSYRIIALVISLLGLIVPIFNAKPIAVMVGSQAFGALVLPATVACIAYIGNKSGLMGEHKFSTTTNVILSMIFVFALFMSYMSYAGILSTLQAL
ncbi:Nramp family divalent metal transporter [Paraglaciecola polaris]|uniref:Nramp family divalent metal transporter n=1 Tax=Paraglaciecola polaris TaxID=222814 RepID=UPI0002D8F866|nr:Nramp family divalent metal transporter [Paraglaciecola polaris]|tara:strand:- start:359 stop:1600 length:1242 start_codon:yes stop_codon:yes gene_type:complete